MTNFYKLEPEVAGGWGKDTVVDSSPTPRTIHELHYEFDGWLGDDIVESTPAFIVTVALGESIQESGLSGATLGPVKITRAPQFLELYPDRILPDFNWLQLNGKPGVDDFALSSDLFLVVSGRALNILKSHNLDFCEIAEWR